MAKKKPDGPRYGPPPLPEADKRRPFPVALSENERAVLEPVAEAAGLRLGPWLRLVALRIARRARPTLRA